MFSELLKHPRAVALSIGFHLVLIAAILINFHFSDNTNLVKQADLAKTVKAEIIDQQQLDAQKNRKKKELEARRKRELEKQKKEKQAKAREEDKNRKQVEEKKRKIAQEKKKQEEAKRIAEAKTLAEQKKKQQEALKKQEELKKQLAAEKQKKLAEEKRKREEKIAREAEQRRLEAERLKQEADKRRLAEEERIRRQQELNENLRAEESQRRLKSLREAYILAIKRRIESKWRQPQGVTEMPDCEVRVIQGPGGFILDVRVGTCPGGSKIYRSSIEKAVLKADPLPKPGDPSLFERELNIIFNFNPG